MVNVNDLKIFYLFSKFSEEKLEELAEITEKKICKNTLMFMSVATGQSIYLW